MIGIPSGLLPSDILTKTLHAPLLSAIRATCSAHLVLLDMDTGIIFSEDKQITKPPIMQSPLVPCYLVPLRLKYLPRHPILEHPQALVGTCLCILNHF
jgi:hypothetical protein